MLSRFRNLKWLITSLRRQIVLPPQRNARDVMAAMPFADSFHRGDEPIAPLARERNRREGSFRWLCTLMIAVVAVQTLRDSQLGVLAATGRQLAAGALREASQWTSRKLMHAGNHFGGEVARALPASSNLSRWSEASPDIALRSDSTSKARSHSSRRSRNLATPLDSLTPDPFNGRRALQHVSWHLNQLDHVSVSSELMGSVLTESVAASNRESGSILPAPEDLVSLSSAVTLGDRVDTNFLPPGGISLTSEAVHDELAGEQPDASTPVVSVEIALADSPAAPVAHSWGADVSLPAADVAPSVDDVLLIVARDSAISVPAVTITQEFSGLLTTPARELSERDRSLDVGPAQSVIPSPEPSAFLLLVVGSSSIFVFQRVRKRVRPPSVT